MDWRLRSSFLFILRISLAIGFFLTSQLSLRAEQASLEATITRFYGDVKILRLPGKQRRGPAPHVEQDGLFYSLQDATLGLKLQAGEWVQTGKVGRVKLVYASGNQVTITRNTKYRILADESGRKSSIMDMLFGNIRVLVAPDADEAPVEARTRTIVLGVRGTEFYLSSSSPSGGPEVSVIRGSLEVTAKVGQADKTTKLGSGYSLSLALDSVDPQVPASGANQVLVTRTSQQRLAAMHQASKLERPALDVNGVSAPIRQEILRLESAANQAVLKDLKLHEPKLFDRIKQVNPGLLKDADQLQEISVRDSYRKAPKRDPRHSPRKPRSNDLDKNPEDVYDKYLDYE